MAKTLTWLHLSDLHAGKPGYDWDSGAVIDELIKDLYRLKIKKLIPDIIIFTGDLVFGNEKLKSDKMRGQYKLVFNFLKQLNSIYNKRGLRHFYIVPGNHDVNRKYALPGDTKFLDSFENWRELVDDFRDNPEQFSSIMKRLNQFKSFLKLNNLYQDNCIQKNLIFSKNINNGAISTNITGLNSAWSCCREREESIIWSTFPWQINLLRRDLNKSKFRVALSHHPVDWFRKSEKMDVNDDLRNNFDVFLHGHEHKLGFEESVDGLITISGGACYNRKDKENGYNIVKIRYNKTTWSGKIWFRRFSSRLNRWKADNDIPRANDRGEVIITTREYREILKSSKYKGNNSRVKKK